MPLQDSPPAESLEIGESFGGLKLSVSARQLCFLLVSSSILSAQQKQQQHSTCCLLVVVLL